MFTVGVITCRPTLKEAEDYHHHVVVDQADWAAAGALGRGQRLLGRRAAEQVAHDPLPQSLPHPPGRGELVGVAGDAGRGQLVDVGEDELGEDDQRLGVEPGVTAVAGHVAPGDPRADPVRREQRIGVRPLRASPRPSW